MITSIKKSWHRLFLVERPSISLSFFRMAAAFTTLAHVVPSFFHMGDNYYETAFKIHNSIFFPIPILELVNQSPVWLINAFAVLFCVSGFFFLIGFLSQLSCCLMVLGCYYFYALNSFHVGTLSWDILLVTLFLMCLTPYHGDYFSLDCLWRGREEAYQRKRPFFIQRLLQLQIGFCFFYTALYKTTVEGNWITENPLFYIMNYPPQGTTKWFLLRDFLKTQPEICYALGIAVIVAEYLLIFLLYWRKTRLSAIFLGCFFHVLLILTLDVPATFFFLFPAQLLLFINPDDVTRWINQRRLVHQSSGKAKVIFYDGDCGFCRMSIQWIKICDLLLTCKYVDFRAVEDFNAYRPGLRKEDCERELILVESDQTIYRGFKVFRRICFSHPMLWPTIPFFYIPGVEFVGPLIYRFIARIR